MAQPAQTQSFETIDITRSDGTLVPVGKIDCDGSNYVEAGELRALAEMASAMWACHGSLAELGALRREVAALRLEMNTLTQRQQQTR